MAGWMLALLCSSIINYVMSIRKGRDRKAVWMPEASKSKLQGLIFLLRQ